MTDIATELDLTADIPEAAPIKGKKNRAGRHAPEGFKPAAVFLLGLGWENLFEPVGNTSKFRCKGCDGIVSMSDRQPHHTQHKRAAEQPIVRAPNPNTPRKENDMAKKDTTPKISKTKVAREAAISVLKAHNKPMTMPELVAKVMTNAKVKEAGVPERTIQAQVNFELQEKQPMILRVDRGVYAHKDAADKKAPARPEAAKRTTRKATSTKRTSTKKTTATKKTSAASRKGGDLAGGGRPDPKRASTSSKKTTARSSSRSAVAA